MIALKTPTLIMEYNNPENITNCVMNGHTIPVVMQQSKLCLKELKTCFYPQI